LQSDNRGSFHGTIHVLLVVTQQKPSPGFSANRPIFKPVLRNTNSGRCRYTVLSGLTADILKMRTFVSDQRFWRPWFRFVFWVV